MAAENSLLFIDSNIYLDLYQNPQDQGVLGNLASLSTRIFSTRQVADEVRRNKRKKAIDALEKVFLRQIAISHIENSLPHHLLTSQQVVDLGASMTSLRGLNRKLNELKKDLKEQIDRHEDSVSRTLASIFSNSVLHTSEELERARERKDRGNPPGKSGTLGDELNWEQLLVQFRGKARLWVISRDSDYGTVEGKKATLHDLLYDELRAINTQAEAYLFDD